MQSAFLLLLLLLLLERKGRDSGEKAKAKDNEKTQANRHTIKWRTLIINMYIIGFCDLPFTNVLILFFFFFLFFFFQKTHLIYFGKGISCLSILFHAFLYFAHHFHARHRALEVVSPAIRSRSHLVFVSFFSSGFRKALRTSLVVWTQYCRCLHNTNQSN